MSLRQSTSSVNTVVALDADDALHKHSSDKSDPYTRNAPRRSSTKRSVSFAEHVDEPPAHADDGGLLGRVSNWRRKIAAGSGDANHQAGSNNHTLEDNDHDEHDHTSTFDLDDSYVDELVDPDDPDVIGYKRISVHDHEDEEDFERNQMFLLVNARDGHDRDNMTKVGRIQYNKTSLRWRQRYITKLSRALLCFGAPSHRIVALLVSAAKTLDLDFEVLQYPDRLTILFTEGDSSTDTYIIKCSGELDLDRLHRVHEIYRNVNHDELSAHQGLIALEKLMEQPPIYTFKLRLFFAFASSFIICPLAFGGSLIDALASAALGASLFALQVGAAAKSSLYGPVFEITISMVISCIARGLSTIQDKFCYSAISSSSIVGILPGYLILTACLDLASKSTFNGSVKLVYALMYALFLGFGLQLGSDFFLRFTPSYRTEIADLADRLSTIISYEGVYTLNQTVGKFDRPISGTFTFSNITTEAENHIINGCLRYDTDPWYRQPFPLWTWAIMVPAFSLLVCLANYQPLNSKKKLPVMVLIAICGFVASQLSAHYIPKRTDIVSFLGALVVGLMGNTFSRGWSGTAFTAMVPGVLFLVPSGLSSNGGLLASGMASIGPDIIGVVIGITVGLFTSQAIVYAFGQRKQTAVFSF